jgi:small subunit ribosomal protein S1
MHDPNDDQGSARDGEDFAALLAASEAGATQRRQMAPGDVVRGRVIALGASHAFIAIGGKGEAIIDVAEFRDPENGALQIAVGDQIEATVIDDGRTSGTIVLKRTVGRGGHIPGELEQALAHGIAVEGVVTSEIKGGFEIQIGAVRAFCPGSQIDRRRREPASYLGQRLRFRVTKIEAGGRNIVVSRRALLEEDAAELAAQTWERIEAGAVLQGRVSSVRDFGAFVDLGGVEGLIHISELGHAHVSHPSEVLKPDQIIDVKVIKIEPEGEGSRGRIGLSLRALEPDPWASAGERFPVGTTVRGIVRRLENFGAFVEIVPGLDGLVHISKLALDRRLSHARQAVSIGDQVDVTVLAVDTAQRRISLSMVEQAQRARDAEETAARREEEATLDEMNQPRNLGTFADLLAASKRERR